MASRANLYKFCKNGDSENSESPLLVGENSPTPNKYCIENLKTPLKSAPNELDISIYRIRNYKLMCIM